MCSGRAGRLSLATLVVAGGVALLLLLPWTVRNYRAFGTLSLMPNTNSGFALYWASHPIYGTRFETVLSSDHGVSYQELIQPELRHLNEAEMDAALRQLGGRLILDDLERYFWLSLSRIPVQFQFWPTADSSLAANAARLLSFGLALPFILLGMGLFLARGIPTIRQRRFWQRGAVWTAADWQAAQGWLLLGIIVVYNLLHILSWAKVRYRLPTDAFMLLFAGLALAWLWRRWRGQPVEGTRSGLGNLHQEFCKPSTPANISGKRSTNVGLRTLVPGSCMRRASFAV